MIDDEVLFGEEEEEAQVAATKAKKSIKEELPCTGIALGVADYPLAVGLLKPGTKLYSIVF